MTFTHLVIIMTLNGTVQPVVVPVGTFSSLAVCEAERIELLKRFALPALAPNGPGYAHAVICERKT